MTDKPAHFIRSNLVSPVVFAGLRGKHLRYRLADGNKFVLDHDEAVRLFDQLGFSIRHARPADGAS